MAAAINAYIRVTEIELSALSKQFSERLAGLSHDSAGVEIFDTARLLVNVDIQKYSYCISR